MSDLPQASAECSEEPIRIPGSIQQHGFFLLTEHDFRTVLVASENAERFLSLPLRLVLGASLDELLGRELLQALQFIRLSPETDRSGLVTYVGSFRINDELFSVTTHCLDGRRALEFERQDRLVGPEMMNSVITNFVSTLSRLRDEGELCHALTAQVANLTGFDRVLLYSFNQEGHGTVLSEVNSGPLPAYLGLRFPFSDIPQQARDLYVVNTVRIIPDANYTPSPLMEEGGRPALTLDLALSVLRSVSPVHLEYMRNMGTLSSMSISIVVEGRLWGLISGHNAEPKVVPYLVRSACDMLSKVGGTQLAAFATSARLEQTVHFHAVQRDVLTVMAAEQSFLDGLLHELENLTRITNANGVALVVDGVANSFGDVPPPEVLVRFAEWLDGQPELDLFVSAHLGADLPWAKSVRHVASGLLAVRISALQRRYLLWFRPEVAQTVRWAGEPGKASQEDGRLHPRHSFGEWQEVMHGRSERWAETEVESARDFRAALTTIGLRRAEEAVELGEARFQQLTHALPAKIFTANDDGRLTYVNERWLREGLAANGKWCEQVSIVPEDAALCGRLWSQAVSEGRAFETELRLRSGENAPETWNLVRIAPFQRAGAERAGWIGTMIDLTESKQRETALRMTEKLALTGRMTSVIAHEINNPLEAITNLMYLLRGEITGDGPAGSYIGMVESELERISGITKQTLRWNRETSDRMEVFSAGSLVEDVLRLFAGKIRNRQVSLKVEGDRNLELRGVVGQIRQVLANIISNAIDAAPVGGSVRVSLVEHGGEPGFRGFAVQDNGGGISPAALARLFQPFYSTKGDLGNGLGLYISHEIVERHGGRIDVDSTVGSGTKISVWLPA